MYLPSIYSTASPTDLWWKKLQNLTAVLSALPLCLKRAHREIWQYPHLPSGRGGTGKPPDLGACAAIARAVGEGAMTTLTTHPDC